MQHIQHTEVSMRWKYGLCTIAQLKAVHSDIRHFQPSRKGTRIEALGYVLKLPTGVLCVCA